MPRKTIDEVRVKELFDPIWERQPREGDKAWGAFVAYRDMPLNERSLRRLVTEYYNVAPGTKRWRNKFRAVSYLSRKWRWRERVEAYDRHLDQIAQEARRRAIEEMNERHIRIARAMVMKAAERLRDMDPAELSPTETRQFFDYGVRLERLALGEPESVTHNEGETIIMVEWGARPTDEEQEG